MFEAANSAGGGVRVHHLGSKYRLMQPVSSGPFGIISLVEGHMERAAKESHSFVNRDEELSRNCVVSHHIDRVVRNEGLGADAAKVDEGLIQFERSNELGVVSAITSLVRIADKSVVANRFLTLGALGACHDCQSGIEVLRISNTSGGIQKKESFTTVVIVLQLVPGQF